MPVKDAIGAKARLDFHCFEDGCGELIKFDLADVGDPDFQIVCPKCHRAYAPDEALRSKLVRMLKLMSAIRDAEDILGDGAVSVNVAGGSVEIPYALLLTRLNTIISLNFGDRKVDFHLWVEPASSETFR